MARPARLSKPGSAVAGVASAVFSKSQMHTLQSSPPLASTPVHIYPLQTREFIEFTSMAEVACSSCSLLLQGFHK